MVQLSMEMILTEILDRRNIMMLSETDNLTNRWRNIIYICRTTSDENDCKVLYKATVLSTISIISFNEKLIQFTEIHIDGAVTNILTMYMQFTHILTIQSNSFDGW